jgi:hypothetical protein
VVNTIIPYILVLISPIPEKLSIKMRPDPGRESKISDFGESFQGRLLLQVFKYYCLYPAGYDIIAAERFFLMHWSFHLFNGHHFIPDLFRMPCTYSYPDGTIDLSLNFPYSKQCNKYISATTKKWYTLLNLATACQLKIVLPEEPAGEARSAYRDN